MTNQSEVSMYSFFGEQGNTENVRCTCVLNVNSVNNMAGVKVLEMQKIHANCCIICK